MDFDLKAFTNVERMRGDRLFLIEEYVIEGDSRFGRPPSSTLEKKQVPGYAIANRNSVGLSLSGDRFRYDGSFTAYLNIAAGFDPQSVTDKTYLLVNDLGLYELKYLESVRHYGRVFYAIYQLSETDNSKRLFDLNRTILCR